MLSVPPIVRLPLTTVSALLEPNAYCSTEALLSTKLLFTVSAFTGSPGWNTAPAARVTGPAMLPRPPRVAPPSTLTAPEPVPLPLLLSTSSVPLLTVVAPV